jgi:hypothetical protein
MTSRNVPSFLVFLHGRRGTMFALHPVVGGNIMGISRSAVLTLVAAAGGLGGCDQPCGQSGELGRLVFQDPLGWGGCAADFYVQPTPLAVGAQVAIEAPSNVTISSDPAVLRRARILRADWDGYEAVAPGRVAVYVAQPSAPLLSTSAFLDADAPPEGVVDFVWIDVVAVESLPLQLQDNAWRDVDMEGPLQFIPDGSMPDVYGDITIEGEGGTLAQSGTTFVGCDGVAEVSDGRFWFALEESDVPQVTCESQSGAVSIHVTPVDAEDLSLRLEVRETAPGSRVVVALATSSSGALVYVPYRWIVDTPDSVILKGSCDGFRDCALDYDPRAPLARLTVDIGMGVTATARF